MAQYNTMPKRMFTDEGAIAKHISTRDQLARSVSSCLLWEKEFYDDGVAIADRITFLATEVEASFVAALARKARKELNLRHVPLLLARVLAKRGYAVSTLLPDVIQRADELAEFMAIYWADGKQPVSKQVKLGLAKAFQKFNGYQLAKYNRDREIKLRDVLFMTHPKPTSIQQENDWKALADGTLSAPDTWEVALSGGADKKETFERLMRDKKLGGLAFLRNLRNMDEADVSDDLIHKYSTEVSIDRVLPFRFIAASRFVPRFSSMLERMLFRSIQGQEMFEGKTVVLVDISLSMNATLSARSDMTRMDAAFALAMILRELCENVRVFTFSNHMREVPDYRGFSLRDAMNNSMPHGGTDLGGSVAVLNNKVEYDRLVVITDEQSRTRVPDPAGTGVMINVASAKNGVGYGSWTHVDGFSESVILWMREANI